MYDARRRRRRSFIRVHGAAMLCCPYGRATPENNIISRYYFRVRSVRRCRHRRRRRLRRTRALFVRPFVVESWPCRM